jgi:hypothetical protein
LAFRIEYAVIASLPDLGVRVILFPEHRKPSRQVVHQQAGTEVIVRWQGIGEIKLLFDLFLLCLLPLAEK